MSDSPKRVLLYSGGMDSVALSMLWAPHARIYVDLGTLYGVVERERLAKHPDVRVVSLPLFDFDGDDVFPQREDHIIPLRNLLLVCVAAQLYPDEDVEVGLAATMGDRVLDKSEEFATRTTELLSFLWQRQHWTKGRNVAVVLPVKRMTKRMLVEAVAMAGDRTLVEELARESFSCYEPDHLGGECGRCKPCVRKWVAFAAAGYGDALNPLHETRAREVVNATIVPLIARGEYERGTEAIDVLAALGVHDPEVLGTQLAAQQLVEQWTR